MKFRFNGDEWVVILLLATLILTPLIVPIVHRAWHADQLSAIAGVLVIVPIIFQALIARAQTDIQNRQHIATTDLD